MFVALAVVSAAVFVRLGFWQLQPARRAAGAETRSSRRGSRVARDGRRRVAAARHGVGSLSPRSRGRHAGLRARARLRRAVAQGIAGRQPADAGAPPWPRHGGARQSRLGVLARDGATVDLAKWRDRDSTFIGYVEELPSVAGAIVHRSAERASRGCRTTWSAKALPYPVAPFYVDRARRLRGAADRIARLTAPPLDEGPHLSYAIQWFAFAAVALVGAGIVIRQARSSA